MNKIDQDWKNFAEHGILAEGLSPNLFHFTTLRKLINILETNKFLTSVAVGTTSDETDRGKFYFFSMARSKGSSYGKSYSYNEGVTINLDGYKLGHNYKGMPFNYWGNIEQSGQSEAEDRVITDKPFIENASKYITEVHLLLGVSYSKNKWDKVDSLKLEILKKAVDELEKKGIPYWIYHVGKYFTLQSKGNYAVRSFDAFVDIVKRIQGDIEQIEPSSYIPAEKEYENLKAIYEYVDALLRNDLSNMSDYAKKLHEKFKYHGYGMHLNDRIAVLQSDIHNTKSDFGARNHLEKIRQAMRRVGAKTIKELVLWIKEKTDKIAKEEEIKKQESKGYLQLLVDVMDTVWSARDIKQRPSNEVSLTKKIVKGDISATVLEISKHIEEANNAPQGSAQAEELFQLKNRIKYHKDNDRMSGTITSIVQWIKNSIESYRPEEVAFLYEARDNKRVISFDFDNSLSLSKYDEEYGMIDDGPNMEMVNKLKQHKANGDTVYIVTARTKEHEKLYSSGLEKGDAGYTQTVKEFVVDNDLPVDGTYFTNGRLKAKTLLELGVDLHYDDNDDEVQACKDAGIEVIQVVADKMINESLTSLLCEKSIRDVGKEDVIDKNYVKELLRSDDIDRVLVGFLSKGEWIYMSLT